MYNDTHNVTEAYMTEYERGQKNIKDIIESYKTVCKADNKSIVKLAKECKESALQANDVEPNAFWQGAINQCDFYIKKHKYITN